jgi:hypothetical protein
MVLKSEEKIDASLKLLEKTVTPLNSFLELTSKIRGIEQVLEMMKEQEN